MVHAIKILFARPGDFCAKDEFHRGVFDAKYRRSDVIDRSASHTIAIAALSDMYLSSTVMNLMRFWLVKVQTTCLRLCI